VDGGHPTNALSEALGRRLPFGEREIDLLIGPARRGASWQRGRVAGASGRHVLWAGPPGRPLQPPGAAKRAWRKGVSRSLHTPDKAGRSTWEVGRLKCWRRACAGPVLCGWEVFRLLLAVGLDFETCKALMKDSSAGSGEACCWPRGRLRPVQPGGGSRLAPQAALLSVRRADPGRGAKTRRAGGRAQYVVKMSRFTTLSVWVGCQQARTMPLFTSFPRAKCPSTFVSLLFWQLDYVLLTILPCFAAAPSRRQIQTVMTGSPRATVRTTGSSLPYRTVLSQAIEVREEEGRHSSNRLRAGRSHAVFRR